MFIKSVWTALVILLVMGSSCDTYRHSVVIEFRRVFALLVANGDYDELAALFHYPASRPNDELQAERQRISSLLRLLTEYLGDIDWSGYDRAETGDVPRFEVVVSCSFDVDREGQDLPYIVSFPVTFEHAGGGFLHVEFQRLSYWSPSVAEVRYELAEIPPGLEASLQLQGDEIGVIPTLSERLEAEFGPLYSTLDSLFCANDPLGWFDEGNSLSYRNDLGVVLYELKSPQTKSVEDLRSLLKRQLSYEISADSAAAEPVLDQLAQSIWRLWQESEGR